MGRGGKGGKRGPGVGIGDRPKKLRAPKQGKRGVVNESGEQGFHNDNGDWIATGWFDAEGYWYEAAGENDARGQWVATGAYDVYDPEGEWAESGYFDESEEWVKTDGYYDEGGNWVDLDKELQASLPGRLAALPPMYVKPRRTPEGAPAAPPPPRLPSPVQGEDTARKAGLGGRAKRFLNRKSPDGGGGSGGSGLRGLFKSKSKYQVEALRLEGGAVKGGGAAPKGMEEVPMHHISLPSGEMLSVPLEPPALWNDVGFALAFGATALFTLVLAVSYTLAGIAPRHVVAATACTSAPCLHGGSCAVVDKGSFMAAMGDVGYLCTCPVGYTGASCEVRSLWVSLPNTTANAGAAGVTPGPTPASDDSGGSGYDFGDEHVGLFVVMSLLLVLAGGAWALCWLHIVRLYTESIVWGAMGSVVAAQLAFATLLFMGGNGFGVMLLLSAALTSLLLVVARQWVPFVTVMLRTSVHIVMVEHRDMLLVAVGGTLLQALWLLVWCAAAVGAAGNQSGGGMLFLSLALYWGAQVIKNVVHVACAGTAASWYFRMPPRDDGGAGPTRQALRRACSTSFGTICFGSLVISVLRTLRMLVPRRGRGAQGASDQNFFGVCMLCLASLLDRLLELFNQYAFTQVAIYGYGYIEAGRATWRLLMDVGMMPLLNNALIYAIVKCGALISGALTALLALYFTQETNLRGALAPWLAAVYGFIVGFVVALPLMEAIESTCTAILVCYAQNSDVLELYRPQLHALIAAGFDLVSDTQEEEYEEDMDGGEGYGDEDGDWGEEDDDYDEDEEDYGGGEYDEEKGKGGKA